MTQPQNTIYYPDDINENESLLEYAQRKHAESEELRERVAQLKEGLSLLILTIEKNDAAFTECEKMLIQV
jgi:predicted nuclease with TOPRIM domain